MCANQDHRILGIVMQSEVLYKNHLLDSETYIGGKVEALESGVFRSDIPTRFKCKASAYQGLIDCLDRDLQYAITHEAKWNLEDVDNYDEVKVAITEQLEALRDAPNRYENTCLGMETPINKCRGQLVPLYDLLQSSPCLLCMTYNSCNTLQSSPDLSRLLTPGIGYTHLTTLAHLSYCFAGRRFH